MNELGNKIAKKRKDLGITQTEFADQLSVTRQTVSRWEAGTVMPDIDKISDIANILGVSCDYLLKDDVKDEENISFNGISRLLSEAKGRTVRLRFFDEEADIDLLVLLDRCQKLRVKHYEAPVSDHGVDIMVITDGIFDSEGS